MSMVYCHKHDNHYDSDEYTDCIYCQEEDNKEDHTLNKADDMAGFQ